MHIQVFELLTFKSKAQGDLQDGRGVRRGDHLPPHKYIRNTSTCGTTPTEHLLNAGRRPQTSQKIYIFFPFSLFVSVYVYVSLCDFVCIALLLPFVPRFCQSFSFLFSYYPLIFFIFNNFFNFNNFLFFSFLFFLSFFFFSLLF